MSQQIVTPIQMANFAPQNDVSASRGPASLCGMYYEAFGSAIMQFSLAL
jgi:hypothetical protein